MTPADHAKKIFLRIIAEDSAISDRVRRAIEEDLLGDNAQALLNTKILFGMELENEDHCLDSQQPSRDSSRLA
jgi:hypothetical protein